MKDKNNSVNNTTLMMLSHDEIEIDEKLNVRAKEAEANDKTDMQDEIADSVKQDGVLTPIIVINGSVPGKYLVVDGLGRLKTLKQYHPESKIPAHVITLSPALAYYTLNEKKQIFTVIEKAEAIQNVHNELSPNGELLGTQVAEKMGISGPKFSEYRKIASLPEELKKKCRHLKKCSVHELRKIAGIKDPDEQEKMLQDYLQELYPEIWGAPTLQNPQLEETPQISDTDSENNNQIQQTSEDEKSQAEKTEQAVQEAKRDYVKIERKRIEKLRNLFIKKADRIETAEAKATVLKDIDDLIDFLEQKKQELSDQINESEAIAQYIDQVICPEILAEDNDEDSSPSRIYDEEILKQVEALSSFKSWNPINTFPETSLLSHQA